MCGESQSWTHAFQSLKPELFQEEMKPIVPQQNPTSVLKPGLEKPRPPPIHTAIRMPLRSGLACQVPSPPRRVPPRTCLFPVTEVPLVQGPCSQAPPEFRREVGKALGVLPAPTTHTPGIGTGALGHLCPSTPVGAGAHGAQGGQPPGAPMAASPVPLSLLTCILRHPGSLPDILETFPEQNENTWRSLSRRQLPFPNCPERISPNCLNKSLGRQAWAGWEWVELQGATAQWGSSGAPRLPGWFNRPSGAQNQRCHAKALPALCPFRLFISPENAWALKRALAGLLGTLHLICSSGG